MARLRFTVALLPLLTLAACSSFTPPVRPTLSPLVAQGRAVFQSYCARCHSASGETVIVGPSLAGIPGRAGGRVEGLDARAYIINSIMDPDAYVVEGFSDGLMPQDLTEQLTGEELEAVIEYLLTLE